MIYVLSTDKGMKKGQVFVMNRVVPQHMMVHAWRLKIRIISKNILLKNFIIFTTKEKSVCCMGMFSQ